VGKLEGTLQHKEASMNSIITLPLKLAGETLRTSERIARALAGETYGLVQRVRHLRPASKPDMDDVTLARKVETEIFRPADSPKGDVDVNVVEGVVYLRGEVKRPAQIKDLEARTRAIPEVRGVENLLHLPKTPSPTRADSPRRAQKNPPSPKPAPRRRTSATRVRTTAEAPVRASAPTQTPEPAPTQTTAAVDPPEPVDVHQPVEVHQPFEAREPVEVPSAGGMVPPQTPGLEES
jgi:hypothetical protein